MAGVPAKSGLSPSTQREVMWWLAKGHGIEDAARRAGLASTAALYRLKRTMAFADDLRTALRDRLSTELAPKAVKILDELMSDPAVSARVRSDAARIILDRSGFSTQESIADGVKQDARDLTSYSLDELNKIIAEQERTVARTAAGEGVPVAEGEAEEDPAGEAAAAPVDLNALL